MFELKYSKILIYQRLMGEYTNLYVCENKTTNMNTDQALLSRE